MLNKLLLDVFNEKKYVRGTYYTRKSKMEEYQFESLHYTNSLGTDLNVGLPERQVWQTQRVETPEGHEFQPNIPSYELFSAPDRNNVNGVVYSSKPLSMGTVTAEDMCFKFKDGKIADVTARKGEKELKAQIASDPNGCYLGEVSLVSYDTPVSKMNTVFYNTLFDENASCHLAYGASYATCIEGGLDMSAEELEAQGLNQSNIHTDFMIGTKDLNVEGITREGKKVQIMKDGEFVL